MGQRQRDEAGGDHGAKAPTLEYETPRPRRVDVPANTVALVALACGAASWFLVLLLREGAEMVGLVMTWTVGVAALPLGVIGLRRSRQPGREGMISALIGMGLGVLMLLGLVIAAVGWILDRWAPR